MFYVIVILMLVGYVLICSEHFTHVNKATVAMFAGIVGWILFVCMGTHFVTDIHGADYLAFLQGRMPESMLTKQFIRDHVFFQHMVDLLSVVMYLPFSSRFMVASVKGFSLG